MKRLKLARNRVESSSSGDAYIPNESSSESSGSEADSDDSDQLPLERDNVVSGCPGEGDNSATASKESSSKGHGHRKQRLKGQGSQRVRRKPVQVSLQKTKDPTPWGMFISRTLWEQLKPPPDSPANSLNRIPLRLMAAHLFAIHCLPAMWMVICRALEKTPHGREAHC